MQRVGFAVGCGILALCASAVATNYVWEVHNGNWYVAANWDPDGIPGSNDTAVVGNGADAITCYARMLASPPYPHPDSVTVRANAEIRSVDTLDQVRDQYFIIESGAHLNASDYNNKGWNALMFDNTRLTISDNVGNYGEKITITGAVELTASSVVPTIAHTFQGRGTITATHPTNSNMRFQSGCTIAGELHIVEGKTAFQNGTLMGDQTNAFTLRMGAGTTCLISWRYTSTDGWNGTQHLVMDGTGAQAAKITFNDARVDLPLQVDTAVLGSVPVEPGTYTVNTDFTDYFTNTTAKTVTIQVLNKAPDLRPSPVTVILVQ